MTIVETAIWEGHFEFCQSGAGRCSTSWMNQLMRPRSGENNSMKMTVAAARLVAKGKSMATRKNVRPRMR